jgi:hypothetical protein
MEIFYFLCCCANAITFVTNHEQSCSRLSPNVISIAYIIMKTSHDELCICCMNLYLYTIDVQH